MTHVSFAPIWQQGSGEPSTNTFLVTWLAHNKLFPLPASPTQILFWFVQTITVWPVYLYFWDWTCLYMFHSQCFTLLHLSTKKGHPYYLDVQSKPSPHLFASAHSYLLHSSPQNQHSSVQPQRTATEVRKHPDTPKQWH